MRLFENEAVAKWTMGMKMKCDHRMIRIFSTAYFIVNHHCCCLFYKTVWGNFRL